MLHFDVLTPAYIPIMAALHALSFDRGWSEKEFSDLLNLPTTMGFISSEGFILCSVVEGEAEIITLCVSPEARRKGVASALLKKTEENLKKHQVHSLFLEVGTWNEAALSLYHKAGFVEKGRRKGYYLHAGSHYDAILMEKEL